MERPSSVSEGCATVRALLLESFSASGMDECLACLTPGHRDGVCVEVVDWTRLEQTLERLPPTPPLVALVGITDEIGEAALIRLKRRWPHLPVIVIAAAPDLGDVSRWFAAGAADYVTLPLAPMALLPRVLRAASSARAGPETGAELEIEGLVGRGPVFSRVVQEIRAVARCDATVLIEGETGTGKELCARAIHKLSGRRTKPLHAINCGAIPKDLMENELFGHQKSAFTGASTSQLGLIAACEGGSLFFDEVDAFGSGEQATLLRFVQNQEYRPLGATRVLKADVRVLAATNANLKERVRQGHFREDLFYRLDMLRLCMPPLRARREDIPLLARHALKMFAQKFRARGQAFDDAAMEALVSDDWPGNVRQLEHVIGRAVAFAFHEETITRAHLDLEGRIGRPDALAMSLRSQKRRVIEDFERSRVCACLAAHNGNIARAALAAGKNRRAFWELMRKYAIRAEEFREEADGLAGPR